MDTHLQAAEREIITQQKVFHDQAPILAFDIVSRVDQSISRDEDRAACHNVNKQSIFHWEKSQETLNTRSSLTMDPLIRNEARRSIDDRLDRRVPKALR